jgi:hypothetical protein
MEVMLSDLKNECTLIKVFQQYFTFLIIEHIQEEVISF